jgi:3-keto-5-aminohexanoate cleavage enzyme
MVNSFAFLRENIGHIVHKGIPWEMEIAEVGFLHNAAKLAAEGIFDANSGNFWLDYIMGFGGMPATARQLIFMSEEGKRLFPKTRWQVNATGQDQFKMNILGASMGCDVVRVGFEDNVRLPNGNFAKRNHEQVAAMAALARDLGRELATPNEARAMLGG